MTRIVRTRLLLALALGVAATAPRPLLLRSFPDRSVVALPDVDVAARRIFKELSRNDYGVAPLLSLRLQETGVETRLGASLNAPTFDRYFFDASIAAPPTFDDSLAPSCPNGACPFADYATEPVQKPTLPSAPAGILRSVVRVYNAYEETISTVDAALGPTRRRVVEKGSGAIVADSLGTRYVLTAAHIFRDGRGQITAQSLDGRIFPARLILASEECDVALLRVDLARDVPALAISSSWPRQGETVWRAGFGPDEKLQELAGVVKGYVKTDRYATYETLKIDGPARQGDSGGPVYNASGEIVGVVWGTDGSDAYATYCGRVLKTLCDYSPSFAPDAMQADATLSPDVDAPFAEALTDGIPATCAPTDETAPLDEQTPASASKFRDFWNAALAFTVVFAFGFCGFFATKAR
ncbi:MAG: trypsin-like peptidase domain-containing protein [Thermoguttaceae bacterium]|nr:trypsin-like peptidase domain-containing protein [Thermoguttaceae bacterium]